MDVQRKMICNMSSSTVFNLRKSFRNDMCKFKSLKFSTEKKKIIIDFAKTFVAILLSSNKLFIV